MARLEDYALIGDCETAALVSRRGSIDWLCWPRFDSGACFAALLGSEEHGRWLLTAADPEARIRRAYRRDTLILETVIETGSGAVTVIDFMPPRGRNSDVVRLVRGRRGRVAMRMQLVLRFDYGLSVPWVNRLDDGTWKAVAGPDMVTLHTPVALHGRDLTTVAEFDVDDGQTVPFVLTHGPSHLPPPHAIEPEASLRHAEAFWTEWVSSTKLPDGEWADAVRRSLITLKALTYAPTGGIVAAPTTSLPEQIGGPRNWDYRFCWLRDATLTLLALMNAGHFDEAHAWRDWLLRAAAGAPAQMQIMYGLAGERRLTEYEVGWLPGYEASRPVRVGNAAHGQLQLDVFGEVMDALHQAREGGLAQAPDWALQRAMLERLTEVWHEPDRGLWEVRGAPRHFTYSKVMAWVAFERGVRAVRRHGLEGPADRWEAQCREIHAEVCAKGFDRAKNSFVQSYGSQELDASLLMLPMVGFLPPDDPRVQGTIAAVERELLVDGFVRRYDTRSGTDGLPPGEGAFLACTFWLVDAYVLAGRLDDARRLFERLLTLRNDVGLLAEEYDPIAKRLVGNFPQAFSHVALVNSAHNLVGARKPAEQRASQAARW